MVTQYKRISNLFYFCGLLPLICLLAFYLAAGSSLVATIDGTFIPTHADPFYHATRILEALNSYWITEYDKSIHFPHGAWVTWPWGFDWIMARILNILMLFFSQEPMKLLAYIPPFWFIINTLLVVAICSSIKLSRTSQIIASLCFIFIPINSEIHLLGRIDHHFMEMFVVLSYLLLTINWLKNQGKKKYPILLGICLGFSFIIHNGFFILLIPIAASLLICWITNIPFPQKTKSLLLSFLISFVLFALPSKPIWHFYFEFYLFSWFHVYIAAAFILTCLFIINNKFSYQNILFLMFAFLVLLLPFIGKILHGFSFISGNIEYYENVSEVKSLFSLNRKMRISVEKALSIYSWLLFILPVNIGIIFIWFRRNFNNSYKSFIICYSLFASILVLNQLRFHYYGTLLLFIPGLFLLEKGRNIWFINNPRRKKIVAAFFILFALAGTQNLFPVRTPPEFYKYAYITSKKIYNSCINNNSSILARHNVGHFFRYHTKCKVFANSMMLTDQDIEQIKLVDSLFDKSIQEIMELDYKPNYIYVYRTKKSTKSELESYLFNIDKQNEHLTLLVDIKSNISGEAISTARLFRLEH